MPFKRRNLIKKSRLLLQRFSSSPNKEPGNQKKKTKCVLSVFLVKQYNAVPLIGLAIGLSAFTFQVTILYPWHHELSDQLSELKSCVLELHTSNKALTETIELLKQDAEDMHRSTKDLHDSVDLLHAKVSTRVSNSNNNKKQ